MVVELQGLKRFVGLCCIEFLVLIETLVTLFKKLKTPRNFVKIIPKKNDSSVSTQQNRLFYDAIVPVLPCKTAAFAMQNNGYCNALIVRRLCKIIYSVKCLHFYRSNILAFKHCFGTCKRKEQGEYNERKSFILRTTFVCLVAGARLEHATSRL